MLFEFNLFSRLEKLQRLAEKILQEAKVTDSKLDDIENWIEDEAKRVDQLHPKDAKNNCDQIERELQRTEEVIKSMFNDVQVLRESRYSQANELHRRYIVNIFRSLLVHRRFLNDSCSFSTLHIMYE